MTKPTAELIALLRKTADSMEAQQPQQEPEFEYYSPEDVAKLSNREVMEHMLYIRQKCEEDMWDEEYLDDILAFAKRFAENADLLAEQQKVIDGLRDSLKWAVSLFKQDGECSVECFERVALLFRKETGYLRPGKDCIIHDPEVRQAAWDKWIAENISKAKALQPKAEVRMPNVDPKGTTRFADDTTLKYIAELEEKIRSTMLGWLEDLINQDVPRDEAMRRAGFFSQEGHK